MDMADDFDSIVMECLLDFSSFGPQKSMETHHPVLCNYSVPSNESIPPTATSSPTACSSSAEMSGSEAGSSSETGREERPRRKCAGASSLEYNLRPRSILNRIESERRRQVRIREPKPKQKPPPLSKYRRKTANARERTRMQEINLAFETLRKAVPQFPIQDAGNPNSKLTKITTLRLAVNYIDALTRILNQSEAAEEDRESSEVDSVQSLESLESSLDFGDDSACGDLLVDGFDLILESDGESIPLSDGPVP